MCEKMINVKLKVFQITIFAVDEDKRLESDFRNDDYAALADISTVSFPDGDSSNSSDRIVLQGVIQIILLFGEKYQSRHNIFVL